MQLFLLKVADTEPKTDIYYGTPLAKTTEGGHEAVLRLLLEKEADVETGRR